MSDDYTIQVSPKLPSGTLVNVRGKSQEEVATGLTIVANLAGQIAQTETLLVGASVAAAGLAAPPQATPPAVVAEPAPTYVPTQTSGVGAPPPAPAAPVATGGAPNCLHGQRRYYSPPDGSYRGWFCALPKDRKSEQCDPIYVRD